MENNPEDEGDTLDPEEIKNLIYQKIENFFSNHDKYLKRDELDDFLNAIDLLEEWSTDMEKDLLWSNCKKCAKNGNVDLYAVKKGIEIVLFGSEDIQKDDGLLVRISRMSLKPESGTVNNLVLNKYKNRAKEEYECLDVSTLIQIKKILTILNISDYNNKIPYETIYDICEKNDFITYNKNEIIKFLSFLTCDETPISQRNRLDINLDILKYIESFLEEKLEDQNLDESEDYDNQEEDEINDQKEKDPMDIIEDTSKIIEKTKENMKILKEIKRQLITVKMDLSKTVKNLVEYGASEENNEKLKNFSPLIEEKLKDFDKFLASVTKDQFDNSKNVQALKKCLENINEQINKMKEDYLELNEKYKSSQHIDYGNEMNKMFEENRNLKKEISQKTEEAKQFLEAQNLKEEEINRLGEKISNMKYNYENLEKELCEAKSKNVDLEKKNKELSLDNQEMMRKNFEEKNDEEKRRKEDLEILQQKNEDYEKNVNELDKIDSMIIPIDEKILKKKIILNKLSEENLRGYIIKCEKNNIILKDEKMNAQSNIRDLEENMKLLNQDIINYKLKINNLEKQNQELNEQISKLKDEIKKKDFQINSLQERVNLNEKITDSPSSTLFPNYESKNPMFTSYQKSNISISTTGKKHTRITSLKVGNLNEKFKKLTQEKIQIFENKEDETKPTNVNKENEIEIIKSINNISIENPEAKEENSEKVEDLVKKNNIIQGQEVIVIDNINDINLGVVQKI